MKKKSLLGIILTLLCLSLTILSFNYPQQAQGFKNLKVLPKDISKKQLDSVMDYYTVSLGVRCGFCHARLADTTKRGLDFASDKKEEKSRAREMITMTSFINKGYFDEVHSSKSDTIRTVTCFTCHRGKNDPTNTKLLEQYNSVKAERKKK